MKVVFGGQIARAPVLKALRAMPGIELVEVDTVGDTAAHVGKADVLVIANPRGKEGMPLAAALRGPDVSVRWVQVVSAGADGILAHGVPASIALTNQGGAAAPAVAEHAMALLMALTRRIDLISANTSRNLWDPEIKTKVRALEGSTVGIVGMGNIGRQVAMRARVFGVRIVGFSRNGAPQADADEMHPFGELEAHAPHLDSVVSCVALAAQTRHLIGARFLAALKPSSLLVNVSRGEIVDQVALESALREGRLAGAALDVTEPEPLPAASTLWQAPNIIISPHIAATGNSRVGARIAAVVVDNVGRFMAGQPLLNTIEH